MNARFTVKANPRMKTLTEMFDLNTQDMKEMIVPVDVQFTRNEKALFSSQGASGGRPWPALSPAYAKAKARKYPGRKIMQRKGTLRRSLVNRNDPAHVATYSLKPRATLSVGTTREVAAYHIPGPLKNPRLPVRDTLQQSEFGKRKLMGHVEHYLTKVKLPRITRVLQAWKREFGTGRGAARG